MSKILLDLLETELNNKVLMAKMLLEANQKIELLTMEKQTLEKALRDTNELLSKNDSSCMTKDCQLDEFEIENIDIIEYLNNIGINNVQMVSITPDEEKDSNQQLQNDGEAIKPIEEIAKIFGVNPSRIQVIK